MIWAYIGVTDGEWFKLLRNQPALEEANFWQPSGSRNFQSLKPGELFLFKLHSPNNYIVGGGVFAHFSLLPISLAWEAFGLANGARSLQEMRGRVEKYRRVESERSTDYTIGCILIEEPFFFEEVDWIPSPTDWSPNIVQGKRYDLSVEPGRSIWDAIQERRGMSVVRDEARTIGEPALIQPRLGQGAFRILVTDGYERRCAFTGERTLPALDAAHIRPFSHVLEHRPDNGLLLRRDLHALFDRGYLTVTPEHEIEVSRRIKEEFENGKDYYRLHGTKMRLPKAPFISPDRSALEWHNENVYMS